MVVSVVVIVIVIVIVTVTVIMIVIATVIVIVTAIAIVIGVRDDARLGRDCQEGLSIRLRRVELHVEATGTERDGNVEHSHLTFEHAFDEAGLTFVAQANRWCRQVLVLRVQRGAGALDQRFHLLEPDGGRFVVKTKLRMFGILSVDVHTSDPVSRAERGDHARHARVTRRSIARKRQLQVELVLRHAASSPFGELR